MTVVRVMRDPAKVATRTRERVEAVLRKTGYTPDLIARGLASNRSGLDRRDHPGAHELADRRDHAGPDRRARAERLPPAARRERVLRGAGGGAGPGIPVAPRRRHLPDRRHPHSRDRCACCTRAGIPVVEGGNLTARADRHGRRLLERRSRAGDDALPARSSVTGRSATSARSRRTTIARATGGWATRRRSLQRRRRSDAVAVRRDDARHRRGCRRRWARCSTSGPTCAPCSARPTRSRSARCTSASGAGSTCRGRSRSRDSTTSRSRRRSCLR